MPTGVEHVVEGKGTGYANRMRYPLMPTGVEHPATSCVVPLTALLMRYPLMPTGVEHRHKRASNSAWRPMRYPLMPTGVEHFPET